MRVRSGLQVRGQPAGSFTNASGTVSNITLLHSAPQSTNQSAMSYALHVGLSQKFNRFFVRPEYVLSFQFGSTKHQVLSSTFGIGWGAEF